MLDEPWVLRDLTSEGGFGIKRLAEPGRVTLPRAGLNLGLLHVSTTLGGLRSFPDPDENQDREHHSKQHGKGNHDFYEKNDELRQPNTIVVGVSQGDRMPSGGVVVVVDNPQQVIILAGCPEAAVRGREESKVAPSPFDANDGRCPSDPLGDD